MRWILLSILDINSALTKVISSIFTIPLSPSPIPRGHRCLLLSLPLHSQQRFWWTISPRKLYLICGLKVGKCQLLVAKCCQYQTLFCMTVTSSCAKKWFNLFSRWRSWRACRRGDLFPMCQDHQSTHWIIPLLHPFMFLSPCTQGFGRSEALHKVHYRAIYSLFFLKGNIFVTC